MGTVTDLNWPQDARDKVLRDLWWIVPQLGEHERGAGENPDYAAEIDKYTVKKGIQTSDNKKSLT
jgi:hypothetical protein